MTFQRATGVTQGSAAGDGDDHGGDRAAGQGVDAGGLGKEVELSAGQQEEADGEP